MAGIIRLFGRMSCTDRTDAVISASPRHARRSLLANPSPPFAGTISMKTREPLEERLKYIPEYLRIFTGVEPQTRKLERFYSRHGVAGAS